MRVRARVTHLARVTTAAAAARSQVAHRAVARLLGILLALASLPVELRRRVRHLLLRVRVRVRGRG